MEKSIAPCLVLTTWPAAADVEVVARTLVDERLAACVAVTGPIVSHYRWEGRVERADERQVVIKTVREQLSALRDRLATLHPYELPEFLVLDATASDAYGAWIAAATAPPGQTRF